MQEQSNYIQKETDNVIVYIFATFREQHRKHATNRYEQQKEAYPNS